MRRPTNGAFILARIRVGSPDHRVDFQGLACSCRLAGPTIYRRKGKNHEEESDEEAGGGMNGIEKQIRQLQDQYGTLSVWIAILGSIGLFLAFDLYVNWKLFKRIGYPPIWAFFMWIPVVVEFVWLGLAFWRWPKQMG